MKRSIRGIRFVLSLVLLSSACIVYADGSAEEHLAQARKAMQDRNWAGAATDYQKAISADRGNADAHAELGVAYLNMEKLKPAEAEFKRAMGLDAGNRLAKIGMARVCIRNDDRDKATQLLKEAEQTGVGQLGAESAMDRGRRMMEKRMLALARRELVGSVKTEVKDTASVGFQAARLNRLGQYKEAIELLTPALGDDSDCAMLYVQLGIAHHGLGNWTQAKGAFEKAIDISKDTGPAARMAREHLKTITGR